MIPDVSLTGLKPGEATDPKAVAAKVQGMFMEVMLKSMEDSVDAEDGLFGGSASSDIYRGMMREQLANAMSSQLKSPLESQLNRAFQKATAKADETGNSDGNPAVIQKENGRKMLYPQNNQNLFQVGDWVSRGDTTAEVGSTGRATGPNVHFKVKF
jgi:Rod binding domain-containing protein